MLSNLRTDLKKLANRKKAKILLRFFKTGKGEYGEGDVFLGITVPESRKIAITYKDLSFADIKSLLQSKIHEERLIALLILVHNFSSLSLRALKGRGNLVNDKRKLIFDFYLQNTKYINNWDLVDLSADKIVGAYLLQQRSRHSGLSRIDSGVANAPQNDVLTKLAKSKNIWERRIAMIATYQFIKEKKEYKDTFAIAEILLTDKHDLIQKAVGWMLREVGKRISQEVEEEFLKKYYKQMPRTMLRYAIEHFQENLRKKYLIGSVEAK